MTSNSQSVFRFAPSPSGYLHVGGARTAIFNWLLARKKRGKFLLRIEDTDRQRSTQESVQQIINSLRWLGLDWDEEPMFQSQRLRRHQEVVSQLIQSGNAYRCFCAKEILEEQKKTAQREKKTYKYDGKCKRLSQDRIQQYLNAAKPYTVRLKTPPGEINFSDGVHGATNINNADIDDFVIQRSDNTPVYQLAVVVDDHDMQVTHVIRGDDHFSNTPKQILIYLAMNWQTPQFSHLPLILGSDKTRLSKRHGATSVEEFHQNGILSEALFNFLCLLGWSPGDDKEIISKDDLIQFFTLERVNRANAIFDGQKLLWMNGKYLSQYSADGIVSMLKTEMNESERMAVDDRPAAFSHFIRLLKERARTLQDIKFGMKYFFVDPSDYEEKGIKKYFSQPESVQLLRGLAQVLRNGKDFNAQNLEHEIRLFAEGKDLGLGKVIHPLRLAITGRIASPGIFEIMEILGKDRVQIRINNAVEFIRSHKDLH
jgi:glutamyl-tRNA synthetase